MLTKYYWGVQPMITKYFLEFVMIKNKRKATTQALILFLGVHLILLFSDFCFNLYAKKFSLTYFFENFSKVIVDILDFQILCNHGGGRRGVRQCL